MTDGASRTIALPKPRYTTVSAAVWDAVLPWVQILA
jgi:hypothetical protein